MILQSMAENCNDKKYGARVCSERSSEMFFALFVNVSVQLKFIEKKRRLILALYILIIKGMWSLGRSWICYTNKRSFV